MKLIRQVDVEKLNEMFVLLAGTDRSQIACMVLQQDEESGEYGSEHADSDQVLFVLQGSGWGSVEGREYHLAELDTVLIEAGEKHQFRGASNVPFRTLNVYAPKAY